MSLGVEAVDNNPFLSVIQQIREDNRTQIPVSFRYGIVKSVTPLEIDVAGTSQDKDTLLKNDLLINFELGDRLLLLPIDDDQRYIIICKVVDT